MDSQPQTDFIKVVDHALPTPLCNELIKAFEASKHKVAGKTGGGVDKSKKNSTDVSISQHAEFAGLHKQVTQHTAKQIFAYFAEYHFALIGPIGLTVQDPVSKQAVALEHSNFQQLGLPCLPQLVDYLFTIGDINAQKYLAKQGGYPYWHSENYPQHGTAQALHRNLLFMYYLNDVDEGGETEFYYQNRTIRPKAGTMVIAPTGFTHTHRGKMPISNDKYILTSWVLFKPGEHIYTSPS